MKLFALWYATLSLLTLTLIATDYGEYRWAVLPIVALVLLNTWFCMEYDNAG